MAFTSNDNFWNLALDSVGTSGAWVSAHESSPGSTGTGETSGGSPAYARQAIAWSSASSGSKSKTATDPVFDIASGKSITYIGLWSALSSGTFYGYWTITTQAFTGQGTLTVDTATLTKP